MERHIEHSALTSTHHRPLFFYAGVFFISLLVISMQILQARLLSVITWYHLAFLVISVAMFGLIIGALKVHRGIETKQREQCAFLCYQACLYCGLSTIIVVFVQVNMPYIFSRVIYSIFVLPMVALLTSIPYYYAGIAISLSLNRSIYPTGVIYGMDLFGAAMGCLAALFLLNTLDTPSAMISLSVAAACAALLYQKSDSSLTSLSYFPLSTLVVCAILIVTLNGISNQQLLEPLSIKEQIFQKDNNEFSKWNAISFITLSKEKKNTSPFLWGASPNLPKDYRSSYKQLLIDGLAGTPITRFKPDDISALSYLAYDVTNIAYTLPDINKVLIIGVGGGRDVLAAKYFGAKTVTALDLNPIQINMHLQDKKYANYSNLNKLPGVTLLNYEARSWLRQGHTKFNLIQMSLVDTWAATTAGSYALSENGLYTVESWCLFLDSLSDDGFFTTSRWYSKRYNAETGRILSLAIYALFKNGVKNVRQHIFLAGSDKIATLIVSKSPFTLNQLALLEKQMKEKAFITLVSPNQVNANHALFNTLLSATDAEDLKQKTKSVTTFDLSPSTDMRPYFFYQIPFSVAAVKRILSGKHQSVFYGQAMATINLITVILLSIGMVLTILFLSLKKNNINLPFQYLLAGISYFSLIGLGFMIIEISLLQSFGLYLGHPIYGLSIVLFSLILSTGLGSVVSTRYSLSSTASKMIWSVFTSGYVLLLAVYLNSLFSNYAEISLLVRALISVLVIFPCGFLLGFGLPTGFAMIKQCSNRATTLFWAINGAMSILASALAIALNIILGIDKTLMIGALCYLALVLPCLLLNRAMLAYTI